MLNVPETVALFAGAVTLTVGAVVSVGGGGGGVGPAAENVCGPAGGLALDGSRAYFVEWKGRLWAVDLDPGPPSSARCVLRPG